MKHWTNDGATEMEERSKERRGKEKRSSSRRKGRDGNRWAVLMEEEMGWRMKVRKELKGKQRIVEKDEGWRNER